MNLKKRPALLFVLTAFTVVVCRCAGTMSPVPQPILAADGSTIGSCEELREVSAPAEEGGDPVFTPVWECSVTCADNSQVKFDTYTKPPALVAAGEKEAFLAQYCSAEVIPITGASETPTEEPASTAATSTPLPTATEQVIIIPQQNILILQPILAGTVSACDTGLGFINFPFAEPLPDLTGKNLEVIFNGYKVNCAVAGSRGQVLGCSLPPDTTFPLQVGTTLDSVQVDVFTFSGATCTKTLPTKERNPNDPNTAVAPVAPTPVDCTIDPYNPAC